MPKLKTLTAALVLGAAVLSSPGTFAQAFPNQPIKIIVPYAPGGVTDLVARTFQRAITEANILSQPVTVVNMPGAGSTVGARYVMNSAADGHTILLHHLGLLSGQAAGMWEYGYDDFELIAGTTRYCHVLVVGANSPFTDLESFLAKAKAEPDSIVFGVNLGGAIHMAGLVVQSLEPNAKLRFAQIGGEVENITSIKGNIIQATALSVGTYNQYKAEGLRALVALAPERNSAVADVPTAVELGHEDSSVCVTHSWYAPGGTPQAAVDTLADAFEKAMEDPQLQQFFIDRSMELTFVKGAEMKADLDATYNTIAPLASQAMTK
jgi:tripartite-type tricarboxylate transporter receptor subunit TctC